MSELRMEYNKSSKSSRSSKSGSQSGKSKGMFTSYFRNKQRRDAEKKEERRQLAEEKLRVMLAPVQFSEEEEERLRELKRYKRWKKLQQEQEERQRELKSKAMPSIPETQIVTSVTLEDEILVPKPLPRRRRHSKSRRPMVYTQRIVQQTMKALHQHTWEQRVAVVTSLMALLFISLHADILGPRVLPQQLFLDNSQVPWYIIVLKDWGTFCHISTCSLIHFALCDISLIYAFESIEVGKKTGPKVKEFYREKVHVVVAALSGGIVALSICKALLEAWFRMLRELLETAISLVGHGKGACASLYHHIGNAPQHILNGLAKLGHIAMRPSEWISSVCSGLARLLTGLCIWVLAVVIPFDSDDRPLVMRMMMARSHEDPKQHEQTAAALHEHDNNSTMGETIAALNATLINITLNNSNATLVNMPKAEDVIYWRNDAFETCRYLLSHSAFFLVSLLVAMHYYTRGYRHKCQNSALPGMRGNDEASFLEDHSSIRTTPSLARDETELHANLSSDTSMETSSTIAATRPTSITVTIAADY
ncbi:expressed unknown protein [Seminavis robusta]|uniref:Uncharacterized protein n=1 Tax=Seminavis robusta TaxID=568900 RepID=A0A9N8EN89_9STRA|nr:expressed unknown protein [Seminavis robusta]|eukprot:Sro1302_g260940.1 n/a (536) ;mRNA; f:28292-29899